MMEKQELKIGQIYRLADCEAQYYCFSIKDKNSNTAIMQSIKTGWTVVCHDIQFAPDGSIFWSHSTGGYFERG